MQCTQVAHALLCIASPSHLHVCESHLMLMDMAAISFYGAVVFPCVNAPHCINSAHAVGNFWILAITKNAAVHILVYAILCTHT